MIICSLLPKNTNTQDVTEIELRMKWMSALRNIHLIRKIELDSFTEDQRTKRTLGHEWKRLHRNELFPFEIFLISLFLNHNHFVFNRLDLYYSMNLFYQNTFQTKFTITFNIFFPNKFLPWFALVLFDLVFYI